MVRRTQMLGLICWLGSTSLMAAGPSPGRLTDTFEGIECEFSPGQEALTQALAHRFRVHNAAVAEALAKEKGQPDPAIPLSPAEMRTNRAAYLGRIAALLGLERPTAGQEECYDAFLGNYEETMILSGLLRRGFHSLQIVPQMAVWDREDLVRRIEGGEKISGMSYDPVTKSGGFNYGRHLADETNERLAELEKAREQLRITTDLNLETKDGLTTYRARFAPRQPGTKRTVASVSVGAPAPAEGVGQWFPVIIPPGAPPGDRPGELAQFLWDGMGDSSVTMILAAMANQAESVPRSDPQIAFLLLHETTEMGIVDHYYRGRDRRWFCDGVANYGAWRVLCDLRGERIATQVHDLGRQLREFADLGGRADLRKWPAVEDESGGAQAQSRLNLARYTFAERAVALMVERGGPDILPRLFAEIGRTNPEKVAIRTVEQAWRKLTGIRLEVLLAEAVKPLPPAARSADMGPAKGK